MPLMLQPRSSVEIARIDAALAAREIPASRLHRALWRFGVALPPAALMPLPFFIGWQIWVGVWIIGPAIVIAQKLRHLPGVAWTWLGWFVLVLAVMLVLRLLWRAIALFKDGGIAWIEKLAVAGLITFIVGAGVLIHLTQRGQFV